MKNPFPANPKVKKSTAKKIEKAVKKVVFSKYRIEPVDEIPLPITEAVDCNGRWMIYTSFLKVSKYWDYLASLKPSERPDKGVIIDGETKVYFWDGVSYLMATHTKKELNAIFSHRLKAARPTKKKTGKKVETKWTKHLAKYREKHPGKSLTECMKEAKKTYKPVKPSKPKTTKKRRRFGYDSDGFEF